MDETASLLSQVREEWGDWLKISLVKKRESERLCKREQNKKESKKFKEGEKKSVREIAQEKRNTKERNEERMKKKRKRNVQKLKPFE